MSVASLTDIPAGCDIFLDANVIFYALTNYSGECLGLLERCAGEDLHGVTTLDVMADVTHQLMLTEAFSRKLITQRNVRQLEANLRAVTRLTTYWSQVSSVFRMNILVLPTEEPRHLRAQTVRATHGLLTNDSIIVAAMQEHGLAALASADSDFDHIPGLTRYTPTDI